MLGQIYIELHGNFANTESYFFAYHRIGKDDATKDAFIGGRYNDRLEKRNGQWKFIHRVAVYDWYNDAGPSLPWDNRIFPFSGMGSRSYGRTSEDYTWELFKNEPLPPSERRSTTWVPGVDAA